MKLEAQIRLNLVLAVVNYIIPNSAYRAKVSANNKFRNVFAFRHDSLGDIWIYCWPEKNEETKETCTFSDNPLSMRK